MHRATRSLILLFLALAAVSTQALAEPGRIVGRVLDDQSGKGLPFTNVSVVGTTLGTITREDGSFVIGGVEPGTYEIQATFMGYETQRSEVVVNELRTTEVEIRLTETVAKTIEEQVITAERPLIDVDRGSTIRSVTGEEIENMTVEPTLDSVIEQQAGVTRDRDKIHVRGGRSDETLYIVDGVQMRDLLSGESQGGQAVSARSVAEVNLITGGFDAKYGQALAGIVEAKIKEGSEDYEGFIGYTTDQLTDDWEVDLLDFQVSGPLPLLSEVLKPIGGDRSGKITFFLNLSSDLSNGHLPTIRDNDKKLNSSYHDEILGSSFRYKNFFYPRSSNNWRALFKSAWKASPNHKFSMSVTKNMGFNQGFGDTDIGQINRNSVNYPWAWSRNFGGYYTVTNDQNSFSFTWNHTLKSSLLQQVKITRYFSSQHRDVAGKLWTDYDPTRDAALSLDVDDPYFINIGDASDFRDRFIKTWALDWDWTHKWRRHDIRWGLHAQYEDVQYLSVDAASYDSLRAPLGDQFDLFHVYPNTGAFYLQDRLEFEGLVANVGLRYDYWFPGEQVENLYDLMDRPTINEATRAEFYDNTHGFLGHRFKGHLAPRLQVSHPITERDHLFFNYGHFSQRPAYFYVYAKSSSQSSEEFPRIGNPNLDPEVSVQYELGAGHQFSEDKAVKVSVYNKDIYDYPASTTIVLSERGTRRSDFTVYRNLDYARSRGIEVELRKRRTDRMSWAASYTFSNAKGKSSDPNNLTLIRESGGDARETSLDEEFMWWNRPHKLTTWFNYRVSKGDKDARLWKLPLPQDMRFNAFFVIQSGRAYTPEDLTGARIGVAYSKNGPFDSSLNATLVKGFQLGGRQFELTIQGWNLLNRRNAIEVDPVTGKRFTPGEGALSVSPLDNPANLDLSNRDLFELMSIDPRVEIDDLKPGTPEYEEEYNRQTQELADGLRRQILSTVFRYSDPSVISPPRHVRVGIGMDW